IVMMDRNAGLYGIDPAHVADNWLLAEPLSEVAGAPVLVRSGDGGSVAAITAVPGRGQGPRLVVRRFTPGEKVEQYDVALPSALAGTPALAGSMLLVPLANGSLHRLALGESTTLEEGPTWRGERLPADSVCHLAVLGGDEFLTTDGGRVLTRWSWPKGRLFERRQSVSLPERIASAPAIFAAGGGLRAA